MQISKRIDYALQSVLYLASLPEGSIRSFKEIARACGLPRDFLGKIMKRLADGRLVVALRGATGGYRLARRPQEISFLDVIEAVEGAVGINVCLRSPEECPHHKRCRMIGVWDEAQRKMLDVLRSRTLDQVVPSPSVDGSTIPAHLSR